LLVDGGRLHVIRAITSTALHYFTVLAWALQTGRLKASSYRDRVVDVAEEMYKMTMLLRDHTDFMVDR